MQQTPATGGADHFRHSYTRDKAQLVRRLARIEGQVRGISRMIEREEYCVDILQQTSALRAAVDSLAVLVLEDHVQGCVRTAAANGDADRYVDPLCRSAATSTRHVIPSGRPSSPPSWGNTSQSVSASSSPGVIGSARSPDSSTQRTSEASSPGRSVPPTGVAVYS